MKFVRCRLIVSGASSPLLIYDYGGTDGVYLCLCTKRPKLMRLTCPRRSAVSPGAAVRMSA